MVGIDIVDVSRVEGIMKRFGNRFLNRVFSDKELEYVGKRIKPQESLAGRFAAKEAFIKAFNSLEHNVAGETIGDDDISSLSGYILAFNVADEIQFICLYHELVAFLDHLVALTFLPTIAE